MASDLFFCLERCCMYFVKNRHFLWQILRKFKLQKFKFVDFFRHPISEIEQDDLGDGERKLPQNVH
jgi:hypothetical protein